MSMLNKVTFHVLSNQPENCPGKSFFRKIFWRDSNKKPLEEIYFDESIFRVSLFISEDKPTDWSPYDSSTPQNRCNVKLSAINCGFHSKIRLSYFPGIFLKYCPPFLSTSIHHVPLNVHNGGASEESTHLARSLPIRGCGFSFRLYSSRGDPK